MTNFVRNKSDEFAIANGCYYDEEAGQKVVDFIEEICVLVDKGGIPFILEEWQKDDLIRPLYGWKRKNGKRRFNTAFIFISRGAGKTALISALALYHLVADGIQSAEVLIQASNTNQAGISFRSTLEMVKQSEELQGFIKPYTNSLWVEKTFSTLKMGSGDKKGKFGQRPSVILFDELHEQDSEIIYDALKTSLGKKENPLMFCTTTAGWNRSSICFRQYEIAKDIISGKKQDDSFFALIYEADKDCDYKDEKNWHLANPNIDVSISKSIYEQEIIEIENDPTALNRFLRDRLNIWTTQESRWLDISDWEKCKLDYTEKDLLGRTCYGGYDGSYQNDLSSFSLVFPPIKDDEPYKTLTYSWVPEESIERRSREDKTLYSYWHKQGWLEATPGAFIDQEFIMKKIKELTGKFDIKSVAYDQHGSEVVKLGLEKMGIEFIFAGKGFGFWTAPMKEFYRMMLTKEIAHRGKPDCVLSWCLDNLVVKTAPSGDLMPMKEKCREKIDSAVALITALSLATTNFNSSNQDSVYESRGVLLV